MLRSHRDTYAHITVLQSAGFGILLTFLLVLALFPLLPSKLHIREGSISSETITASHGFSYNSEVVRRRLQDAAVQRVKDVVVYDVNVKSDQLNRLASNIALIDGVRQERGVTAAEQDSQLAAVPSLKLSPPARAAITQMSEAEWRATASEAQRVLVLVMQEAFGPDELAAKQASVAQRADPSLSQAQRDMVVALLQPLIVTTEKTDPQATQAERATAIQSVPPQAVSFSQGQEIVRQGQPIDASTLEALRAAGLLDTRLRWSDVLAVSLVAAAGAAILATYLALMQPRSLTSLRRFVLYALLVFGMVLAARLYFPLVLPDQGHRFYPFVLPVALAPMLVAAFFDAPLALMAAMVIAILVTFTAGYLPEISGLVGLSALQLFQMLLAFFFSSVVGVYMVHRAERLNRYLFAGVGVAAATYVSLLGVWLLDGSRQLVEVGYMATASLASGAAASLLMLGVFALLGSLFNIGTRLQLMELGQLNSPLLRRLQEEAPGTFHHSVLVGNLAERAADIIGADALLVRVGCYYHDIGKMMRPAFYVENQQAGVNPHDALEPARSARIITDHVRYGRDLAQRYRLPDLLQAFIVEHHGTRLVTYFYRKAALEGENPEPDPFMYPGPRPQSRETAVVMLADSTEAALRAAVDRSDAAIGALVDMVIGERLAEGELDECDLTLRDLRSVAESFKRTLRAIYHPRIEYPAATELETTHRGGLFSRLPSFNRVNAPPETERQGPASVAGPPRGRGDLS